MEVLRSNQSNHLPINCYSSLVISAVVTSLTQFMGEFLGGVKILTHVLDLFVSFILVTALFAMIYKFLPDVRIRWRDVWIGAL